MKSILIIALMFANCLLPAAFAAKKIPLSDAHFTGDVLINSGETLSIETITFTPAAQEQGQLAYAGGIFIPIVLKVKDKFLFSAEDQLEFAKLLGQELIRLNIFKEGSTDAQGGIKIYLVFKDSAYTHSINEYKLTLDMRISDARNRKILKSYSIDSNERSSGWKKLNTSVWQGKMQAAQVALDKLIPDIQVFMQGAAAMN